MDGTTVRLVQGRLPEEAWVYVVLSGAGEVLHVGSTALPLPVRLWLHLEDDDPEVGRLRAQVDPGLLVDAVVVGERVPAGVDRGQVRDRVRERLDGPTGASTVGPRTDDAVEACVTQLLDQLPRARR